MSKANYHASILLSFLILYCFPYYSTAKSIEQNLSESTVIVIANLTEIQSAPNPNSGLVSVPGRNGVMGHGPTPPETQIHTAVWKILRTLKGETPQALEFRIPFINAAKYYGDPNFRVNVGGIYLLFLSSREPGGALIPNDSFVPMIPLAPEVAAAENPTAAPATMSSGPNQSGLLHDVIALLLKSLKDPHSRVSDMYLLHTVRNDAVVVAATAAMSDPDINLQQNALCCLATNQHVEVIPGIADAVAAEGENAAGNIKLLSALVDFDSPKAIPYLNELLIDARSASVRQWAAMALNQMDLADKTSVPFLVALLKDPNSRGLAPYYADIILHKLIPVLGPHQNQAYVNAHRQDEVNAIVGYLNSPEGLRAYPGNGN